MQNALSVKLLEFFSEKYRQDTVDDVPYIKTDEARKYSTSLAECKTVDKELVRRFLKFWSEQC